MCKDAIWILKISLLANADQNDSLEIRGVYICTMKMGLRICGGAY